MHIIARGGCNRPTNFGVSEIFRSRLRLSDAPRDYRNLDLLTLEVMALVIRVFVLHL